MIDRGIPTGKMVIGRPMSDQEANKLEALGDTRLYFCLNCMNWHRLPFCDSQQARQEALK